MKKYKLEFSLAAIFVLFIILLMWQSLSVVHPYLPIALSVLCLVFVAVLISPLGRKHNQPIHTEAYAPHYFGRAVVSCLVAIAVTIAAAALLNKETFSKSIDLTENKVNSLSDESVKFLDSLKKDIQIICVPEPNPVDKYCENNANLVSLYSRYSKNILNTGTLNLGNKLLLQKVQPSGFSRLVLLSDTNRSELEGQITESRLTNALINLVKFKKVVYFLQGHGEPPLSISENGRSYADVVSGLQAKAYEAKEWNVKQGDLPSDARVVVAGDNAFPYSVEVDALLTQFVKNGGRVLMIVNPFREQKLDNFYAFLKLKLDPTLLVLNTKTMIGQQIAKQNLARPPVLISNFNSNSPITKTLAQVYGQQAIAPVDGGRPITILDKAKNNATVLISAYSAAPVTLTETQRNHIDLQKPFAFAPDAHFDESKAWPVAVDVTIDNADANKKSEVVVYGFSLVNPFSKSVPISEELIPLTIAHLYQDKELVSIPQRDLAPKAFNLSRNPGAWLPLFAGLLPVVTALMGFFMWIRRRSA